jgi:hypothetical protein
VGTAVELDCDAGVIDLNGGWHVDEVAEDLPSRASA